MKGYICAYRLRKLISSLSYDNDRTLLCFIDSNITRKYLSFSDFKTSVLDSSQETLEKLENFLQPNRLSNLITFTQYPICDRIYAVFREFQEKFWLFDYVVILPLQCYITWRVASCDFLPYSNYVEELCSYDIR